MTVEESTRLAERLAGRGVRAWWARRKLIRAGDRGDQRAIDATWRVWLTEPRDVWWHALSRWGRPSGLGRDRELSLVALGEGSTSDPAIRTALLTAAARADHPIAQTAGERIAAAAADDDHELVDAVGAAALRDPTGTLLDLCAEHQFEPAQDMEPADRAVYYLATGQQDRYRAMDPDGSLLALAYDVAPDHLRGRIQGSAIDAGDVALVRLLTSTGPGGRVSRMASDDARYLIEKLAAGHEWDELWRVAQQLRLLDAVDAVGLIAASDDGWRPAGDTARTLFERIAAADIEELEAASGALAVRETARFRPDGRVVGGALSPDGRRLAIVTEPSRAAADPAGLPTPGAVTVFELPSGACAQRYENVADVRSLHLLHQDDTLLAAKGWGRSAGQGGGVIERYRNGRVRKLYEDPYDGSLVAPHLDGFVAVERGLDHPRLRFFTLDGDTIRRQRASLRAVRQLTGHECASPTGIWGLPGGPLVLGGTDCLMVLDARPGRPAQLLGHGMVPGGINGVCAHGPDHLITTGSDGVRRWRLAGGTLILTAGPRRLGDEPRDPIAIDRRGEVVVAVRGEPRPLLGEIDPEPGRWVSTFLDAVTLADGAHVPGFRRMRVERRWSSPGGGCHAFVRNGAVEVVFGVRSEAVIALADRPLADATPADLAALGAELRTDLPGLRAHPFMELLHACLEHRFDTDVALGPGVSVASESDHDIALGGERG